MAPSNGQNGASSVRLEQKLGLLDVYAISTGAMFASGFFLLPGVAAANAGPAVVLAYAISSLLMIPAMFSIAELSSAMPRAAGTYFFIHRSLGPLAGTIGGLGAWVVLIAKSAFALVGMGAYLGLVFNVPIRPLAIALTVGFALLNIFGAKETASLQVWLVVTLVSVMAFFIAVGGITVVQGDATVVRGSFDPLLPFGTEGLLGTIGLVFISYAGLTKVSSAAEEIRDLDRNLPLGMILSLLTVGVIYTAGVAILVAIIPQQEMWTDLTPVATAGDAIFGWLPGPVGRGLVVIAAVTAFASTGNAGILTASRYPLAMARDRLLWSGFNRIGRFHTPVLAVLVTSALMILAIVFLDVERLASLGSAFLLLLFSLINLSVIVMRESRLSSYAPGYRSPLYPWMQIVGAVSTFGLIFSLGVFYVGFVVAILVLAVLWYRVYVRRRVTHRAAMYGVFQRLGERHDDGVDEELWGILQERGVASDDPFDRLLARAIVIDLEGKVDLDEILRQVAGRIRSRLEQPLDGLDDALVAAAARAVVPSGAPAVVHDLLRHDLTRPLIVLVRARRGVRISSGRRFPGSTTPQDTGSAGPRTQALLFLLSPEGRLTEHLRRLAQLVTSVETDTFEDEWRRAHDEQALLETLLRDERYAAVTVGAAGAASSFAEKRLRELALPGNLLVALVRRGDRTIVPDGNTLLRSGDRLTVIGTPAEVIELCGPRDGG